MDTLYIFSYVYLELLVLTTERSLHALCYLSNVCYSKNNEKWYYMLRKLRITDRNFSEIAVKISILSDVAIQNFVLFAFCFSLFGIICFS